MFSGGPEAPANPTSQPAQGGGGDLEAVAKELAGLPEGELLAFLDALDAALEERGISLEIAAGAQGQSKKQRQAPPQQEAPAGQEQAPAQATERSGRVAMR